MDQIIKLGSRPRAVIVSLLMFLLFVVYFASLPLITDDWNYHLSGVHSFSRLIEASSGYYRNVNGRVLGNALSLVLVHIPWLRTLVSAAVTALLVFFVSRNAGQRSFAGTVLAGTLVFFVPISIFCEVYGWFSGFNNYAVPIIFVTAYVYMIRELFQGERVELTVMRAVAALICGFASTLFVENVTVYVLVCALGVIVWHLIRTRKLSIVTILFLVGAITGALIMFRSPSYRMISDGTDPYRTVGSGLAGTLELIKNVTYKPVTDNYFRGSTFLTLLLTGTSLAVLLKSKKKTGACGVIRKLCVVSISVSCTYFMVWNSLYESSPMTRYAYIFLDLAFEILFFVSVCLVQLLYIDEREIGSRAFFFFVSGLITAAPMLVVTPVGGRCLYATYIFNVIALLNMLTYLVQEMRVDPERLTLPASIICATLFGSYLYIISDIAHVTNEKIEYAYEKIEEGETALTLPLPYNAQIIKQNGKDHAFVYPETGGQKLELTFVSYDEWVEGVKNTE